MSCGKYSPTVSFSYLKDQKWWYKYKAKPEDLYDRDGYDEYGYHHETEKDRAGFTEMDYLESGQWISYGTPGEEDFYEEYSYLLYDEIYQRWLNKTIF